MEAKPQRLKLAWRNMPLIAAVNRCATQKQSAKASFFRNSWNSFLPGVRGSKSKSMSKAADRSVRSTRAVRIRTVRIWWNLVSKGRGRLR